MANKVRNNEEANFLENETPDIPFIGYLPADMKVQEADRLGIPVYDHVPELKESAQAMAVKLAEQAN